jgi:glycosyltransferase involved in cell wall biosynthesis
MTGGTEKYFRDLAAILEDHGHQTIPFTLEHPNNPDTPFAKYFLKNLDYREPSKIYRLRNAVRILARTLYSWEARHKIEALIRDTNPDVAHLQSIEHHISPSILHSLRKYNIPVVQSINTYKLVCASYRLYLFDRGETCERCLYGNHYHAVVTRCVKGSLFASFLAMLEMYLHGWLRIYHLVDRFIVPNRFMEAKLLGAGYPIQRIVKLLNPLQLADYTASYTFGDYILYFGRVDPEKGVTTLVQAMRRFPNLRLIVVGSGTQSEELINWIRKNGVGNVEFVGPKWGDDLIPYLTRARLVVVPSVWYEPSPMVIYQALATGKPVIGSDIGGIPDLLTEETGLLFEPGSVEDLAEKIESLAFDDKRLGSMGRAARHWAEVNLDPERYYDSLMQLYSQVIEEKAR